MATKSCYFFCGDFFGLEKFGEGAVVWCIVDCTISAQGGGVCVDKISFFYHFLTDWFNAVSILLSVQYNDIVEC